MIDTDKYEGHTQGPWKAGGYNEQAIRVWTVDGFDEDDNWIQIPTADRLLALDAPLLLAEVKRLRDTIEIAIIDLEQPNMHEETRKDMLDMLKEMIE
jgi:hypothetical protein